MTEKSAPEQLDAHILPDLKEAMSSGRTTYRALRLPAGRLREMKEDFIASDEVESPDLTPDIEDEVLDVKETKLVEFKARLLAEVPDGPVKQAYRWRVNESLALVRMARAARDGDQRRFKHYNEFVYGPPQRDVFVATNEYFRGMAVASIDHDNPNVVAAAQELLDLLPDLSQEDDTNLLPEQSVFDNVKNLHTDFYKNILEGVEVPEDGYDKYLDADTQTRQIMANIGISDYDLVDQDEGVATWDVANIKKQVRRPTTTPAERITPERFIGLVAGHELGTHVAEYLNGQNQVLGLISTGLDRASGSDEGKASIREQIVYSSPEGLEKEVRYQEFLRRHYAISLGYGHLGHPANFSEVFRAVNAVDKLWERIKNPDDPESADKKAFDRTWTLLSNRTLKGTDGTGGAYYKDKIYLEANLAYWQLAQERPDLLPYWDIGNIDMTNPRHVSLLIELGIINDQELEWEIS